MLVAVTVTLPSCSWDRPGADPYMGSVEAAVDRYRDIPMDVRDRLKAKMRVRAYDDIATITRDKILGKRSYSNLRDMHFGNGRICREVTRTKWLPEALERGLVYCEGEHCLIIPTVCRNVSRVTPDTLDIETAAGPPEEPIDPPSSAGSSLLGSQRFIDETGPLATQRLLLERRDRSIIPEARKVCATHPLAHARLHALYLLEGLDALDERGPTLADVMRRLDELQAALNALPERVPPLVHRRRGERRAGPRPDASVGRRMEDKPQP